MSDALIAAPWASYAHPPTSPISVSKRVSPSSVSYEAVTGQLPFKASSLLSTMHEIALHDPPPPSRVQPRVPVWLEQIILRCLRKQVAERYQSMTELLEALRSGAVRAAPETVRASTSPASSIAVLPFASASGDGEQFGDGLAEELIHALSLYDDLQVIARASAAALRGHGLDIREIGRRLNVGVILDGSVRRAGNRLRITVQLIDVNDGHHLWSDRFDREMTDVLEVQDEITAAIVDKLRPQLLGARSPLGSAPFGRSGSLRAVFEGPPSLGQTPGRHHGSNCLLRTGDQARSDVCPCVRGPGGCLQHVSELGGRRASAR